MNVKQCYISHTAPPLHGILLPLPQKVEEGTVFHLNKHYGVMLDIIHRRAEQVRRAVKYFLR